MIKDSVLVTTPGYDPPNWQFMESIFGLEAPGPKSFRHRFGRAGIAAVHNDLTQDFLSTDYEWQLMVDLDAKLHPKTLMRLLSWEEPFVSVLAHQRKPPYVPVFYRDRIAGEIFGRKNQELLDWVHEHPEIAELGEPTVLSPRPDNALRDIDRSGCHCTLVHRSIFETLSRPWFKPWGSKADRGQGCDFYFTKKVIEAGFEPKIDLSVMAGHTSGSICITTFDWLVWNNIATYHDNGRLASLEFKIPKKIDKGENNGTD